MDSSDIKKDNLNTILTAIIILLIVAIFLPPIFRYLYGVEKKETKPDNTKTLICRKEEPVAIDQRGTKIAIIIEDKYESDKLNTVSISFDYPSNIRDDEIATSLIIEEEKRKVDSFASTVGVKQEKNGTKTVYRFDVKTKPEYLQNEIISKYGSAETIDVQRQNLQNDNFLCNK